MNQYFNMKVARQSAKIVDVLFLLLHSWFLYYFFSLGVMLMFYLNILSVIMYAVGYWYVSKYKITTFIYVSSVEIWIHMVVSALCVGMGCGFQWILLFHPIELYYVEYFSMEIRGETAHARSGSALDLVSFILLELYMAYHEPLYSIPEWVMLPSRISVIVIICVVAVFLLQTLTKNAYLTEQKLHEKAVVDGLTGLYNRFEMMDELENLFQRKQLKEAWVAMIDLDDFKKLNEKYGRSVGDNILMQVADILRNMEDEVCCARWGGDEFMVCGFHRQSDAAVFDKMEKVRRQIENIHMEIIDKDICVKATVGISFYKEGRSIQNWLNTADKKLCAGKYNGKNRVVN